MLALSRKGWNQKRIAESVRCLGQLTMSPIELRGQKSHVHMHICVLIHTLYSLKQSLHPFCSKLMLVTVVLAARFSLCLPGSSSWLAFLAAQTYYQLFSPLTQLVGGWGLLFRKKSWCQNWSSLRKSALASIAMRLLLQC